MSDVPAAAGFDRLPWLADDLGPIGTGQRRHWRLREFAGWAVAALLTIAGASYWMGVRSADPVAAPGDAPRLAPPVTVPLPAPRDVRPAPLPEVSARPAPQVVPVAAPPAPPRARVDRAPQSPPPGTPGVKAPDSPAKTVPPAPWPVRVEAGASGRMVRIGTFATRRQAKRGWSRIMRLYPGMSRLPALVVPQPSLRDRRTYYRLQMGTTSQAHSEVLCQRMRIIAQSCVVVDLPAGSAR